MSIVGGAGTAAAVAKVAEDRTDEKRAKKRKKLRKAEGKAALAEQAGGNGHAAAATPAEPAADNAAGGARLSRKRYEKELVKLQTELCKLQQWVVETGQRVVVVFEGRDAAGKGGIIRALTEKVSPRVFRVAALPAPSDREKSQLYVQRFLQHFPAAGEVVIFDRSWYNRAGVERVMGFVSKPAYEKFLAMCPQFERVVVDNGIILIKYWLEVSEDEQKRRFEARINDPLRQWKLSAMDLPSRERWYDYSLARDRMLAETDKSWSPWYLVRSDAKRRARLGVISHLLSVIPYEPVKRPKLKLPERSKKHAYDDDATIANRRWIPEYSRKS